MDGRLCWFWWSGRLYCWTDHIYQLGEFEFELDGDGVRDVDDGADQLVVAGQQVVKQSLGVRVPICQHCKHQILHVGINIDGQAAARWGGSAVGAISSTAFSVWSLSLNGPFHKRN